MRRSGNTRSEAGRASVLALRSAEARTFEDRRERWMAKRRELEAHYLATGVPAVLVFRHVPLFKVLAMFCRFHPRHVRNRAGGFGRAALPSSPPSKSLRPPPQHLEPSFIGGPRRDAFGRASTSCAFIR